MTNKRLPKFYHWGLHIFANAVVLVTAGIVGAHFISPLSFGQFMPFSVYFISWAIVEYLLHRFVLHGSVFGRLHLQREHTVSHHGYFDFENMAALVPLDLNRVLLFSSDLSSLIFAILLLSAGLAYWSVEQAALLATAGISYVSLYELCHWYCHSVGARGWLASHHRVHHHSRLMNSKNFSVVFPFLDLVFHSYQSYKQWARQADPANGGPDVSLESTHP